MALSYEQRKALLSQQAATPMMMSLRSDTEEVPEEVFKKSNKYTWYEHTDAKISYIDDLKVIKLDDSQFNLTQETRSQLIPFQMSRYYDNVDLLDMDIQFHYVNDNGQDGLSRAVNVEYSDTSIRFGWLVDEQATAIAGLLKFEIVATGKIKAISSSEEIKEETYIWKTRPHALEILKSLSGNGEPVIVNEDWFKKYVAVMEDMVSDAEEAAATATSEANFIRDKIDEYVAKKIDGAVDGKLDNYTDTKIGDTTKEDGTQQTVVEYIQDTLTGYYDKEGVEGRLDIGDTSTVKAHVEAAIEARIGDTTLVSGDSTTTYDTVVEYVDAAIEAQDITGKLESYYTKDEVDAAIQNNVPDVSGQIEAHNDADDAHQDIRDAIEAVSTKFGDLGVAQNVKQYVDDAVASVNVEDQLKNYALKTEIPTNVSELINDKMYADETYVDNKVSPISSSVEKNRLDLSTLSQTVASIQSEVGSIDKSARKTYEATYGDVELDNGEIQESMFTLWEIEGDGEPAIKSRFKISGGNGSIVAGNNLTISYEKDEEGKNITQYVFTKQNADKNEAVIHYSFSGTDSAGDEVSYANATWKFRKGTSGSWQTLLNTTIYPSDNIPFDISDYISVGTCQIQLVATDESGGYASKTWTIQTVDIRLESNFDDTYWRPVGQSITFDYTPHGAIAKDIHFKLKFNNGEEMDIGTINTTASGVANPIPLEIPAQEHGSYLLEAYITAKVNGQFITTEPIYKDIMFYDSNGDMPVIGCSQQNITMRQYDSVHIVYHVFDPTTNYPVMRKYVDDRLVDEGILEKSRNEWDFQTDTKGFHTLKIVIGDDDRKTEKIIVVDVKELDIDVTPITSNLEIDFNPIGITNSSKNKIWSNDTYSMTVSPNFDWENGGYKGEYFLVKAGTRVEFDYFMFNGGVNRNPSVLGSEMKIIFMTENVQDANAVWFSNVETTTIEDNGTTQSTNVGIQLGVHEGWLKTNNASDVDIERDDDSEGIAATNTYLYMPYSEEDIIEMDINIDTIDKNNPQAQSFVMAYEDGVPSKAFVYDNSDRFYQYDPKPIVIGSDDCDVRIYRMKIYSSSLTTENIMKNFIADSRNSTTMLDRYDRNSIYFNRETNTYTPYSGEGVIDPERLASVVPNVKILMLETDHFTTSKKTFVKSKFRCIHASGGDMFEGDPYYDNWLFENGWHSGQGTTSDNYGNSSRNVDFLFNCDGVHKPSDKVDAESDYISQVTLGYGTENETTEVVTDWKGDSGKVSLTRTSVPNNFFNLKVNVASSENVNNMLLQKRYNDFLPYISPAKQRNSNVKCTMEFVPAILFIRETNPDPSTHNEFLDDEWHFYSLGNIGDSKKTDYTRAYDPEDMNEFTLEISDNTKNNATFQSGVYIDNNGNRQIEKFTITESEDDGEIILTPVSIDKPQSFIYPITKEEWEDEDNMRRWCIYNEGFDGDHSFEARYACCGDYRDGKLVNDTSGRGKEQMKLNEGVWRAFYRWVITSTDDEFKKELDEWCVRSAVEFFYAFTHMYTMMDNRAKNTFWHFAKTGTYRKVSRPVLELLHIYCELIDGEYVTTSDTTVDINKTYYTQYAFDMHDYDNDTALGINNNGELVFPYGKEDGDYNIDGNPASGYVFNGATSVFWCRLRDLLPNEIKTTFQTVASECFSATDLIKQFDSYQECFPEEIWRLDIQRKYIRTFTGESIDNSKPKRDVQYLRDMMQGRKKYQRRQWIRDQELYFGTMNIMDTIVGDDNRITFRCYTPTGNNVVVAPNYTLSITPYSDMYVSVMFGNGGVKQKRAKAGKEYTIECPLSTMDDTQVTIYGANRIQALNDLSACYIAANNFSNASRLKKLVIGNTTKGYNNSKLVSLSIGNNKLLEELDIRNCNSLTGSLPLAECHNLLRLYAEGTKLTGVTFATNGKIQLAHLPDSINTLTMRNLNDLVDFDATLKSLETLTLQGGTLDSLDIITNCINTLKVLYLYDIDWKLDGTGLLDKIVTLYYSWLDGKVHVPTIKQKQLEDYQKAWSDLDITYDEDGLILQHPVTFVNYDGTPLYTLYVDDGGYAVDPVENGTIPTPTRESTVSTDFTYAGWNDSFKGQIWGAKTITAQYSETIRKYKIRYVTSESGKETLLQESVGEYGTNVPYTKAIPTYISKEDVNGWTYYLFNRWDKSGLIDGDKTVTAIFDTFKYTDGVFDDKKLSDLSAVEIYALTKLTTTNQKSFSDYGMDIKPGDEFTLSFGSDFNYDDLTGYKVKEIVSREEPKEFNGTNYYTTDIKLFEEDQDFVLAIEYNVTKGDTIAQCYSNDMFGTGQRGFIIRKNDTKVSFGFGSGATTNISNSNSREIVVIRHVKGENGLHVYSSSTGDDEIVHKEFISNDDIDHNRPLVFGCSLDNSGNPTARSYSAGTIYWSKVWFADLGDNICRDLASWPHETLKFTACYEAEDEFGNQPAKTYTRKDDGTQSSMSFIASSVLAAPKKYNDDSKKGNTGGWAASDLRDYLNKRIYNAIPVQWRQLLKKVGVSSTEGNGSTDIFPSEDYIFIPSISEVYPGNYKNTPYAEEGSIISHMTNLDCRKCYDVKGNAVEYWTRSPNALNGTSYIYTIQANGGDSGFNYCNDGDTYVRIMFTI